MITPYIFYPLNLFTIRFQFVHLQCIADGMNIVFSRLNSYVMKKTIRYLIFLAAFTGFLVSCDPNDNSPDDTDPRDKFVGNWTCNENSTQNGSSTFTVNISLNSGNSTQIYIANLYALGTSNKVYAVVAGDNATIPQQNIGSYTANGSGSMYSNDTKIDFDYYMNDGADKDTCSAVFTKQ